MVVRNAFGASFSGSATIEGQLSFHRKVDASTWRDNEDREIFKAFEERQVEITTTRSKCSAFTFTNNAAGTRPRFLGAFYNKLKKLHESLSGTEEDRKRAYLTLILMFGTHYISNAVFGASVTLVHVYAMRSSTFEQQEKRRRCSQHALQICQGAGVQNMASFDACVNANSSECGKAEWNQKDNRRGSSTSSYLAIRGSPGCRDLKKLEPIEITITPIQELVQQEWVTKSDK